MNTLKESTNINNKGTSSPVSEMSSVPSETPGSSKPKSPLKKEELEKIAKQLKNRLSKASITAKQSLSPTSVKTKPSIIKSSPLKSYMLKNLDSPNSNGNVTLSSSPNGLYSPTGKSPTHMNTSSSMLLASSPLRGEQTKNEMESPSKKRKLLGKDNKSQPQMILQQIHPPLTPPKMGAEGLKPSPSLKSKLVLENKDKSNQTTPELQKRQLHVPNQQQLLKTPTSTGAHSRGNGNYNDEEGADLLMYLATSPSPAKPMFSTSSNTGNSNNQNASATSRPASVNLNSISSGNSLGSFIAPPPPLTPKRPLINSAKTPQNRLTPSVNLFNNLNSVAGSALPSSGLALTPAGFNMSDYVNFFTPSPGGINMQNSTKNFLKTPDINGLLNNGQKQRIDGKMINFDKVMFGNTNSSLENQSKE